MQPKRSACDSAGAHGEWWWHRGRRRRLLRCRLGRRLDLRRLMNTWPISSRPHGQHLLIGIPPRLGDGAAGSRPEWPALEQLAGDAWLEQVLALVMPPARAWLWWTPSQVFGKAKLHAQRAPSRITPADVRCVLRRNVWLRQMSLIVVPGGNAAAQEVVISWAGADTEQVPDHLWTAPDGAPEWDLQEAVSWCLAADRWKDPAEAVSRPAERVVTLFDGYVFCALPRDAGEQLRAQLAALAEQWGLRAIDGAAADAWFGHG